MQLGSLEKQALTIVLAVSFTDTKVQAQILQVQPALADKKAAWLKMLPINLVHGYRMSTTVYLSSSLLSADSASMKQYFYIILIIIKMQYSFMARAQD